MEIKKLIRKLFHLSAFTVFLIQAYQSLIKYFSYPTVIQQTWIKVDTIEKPYVQVCFPNFFDYGKASEYGYQSRSKYLAGYLSGVSSNFSKPKWMDVNSNATFQEIQKQIYAGDFSKVKVNQKSKSQFILNKGFCLEIKNLSDHLRITTTDRRLRVYLIHNSTNLKVISNSVQLEFGITYNLSSDFKVYELNYEIHDNTINEGTTCFDYRKQKETYGDCNYNALKNYIYSAYGCYPPWMMDETDNKICEIGLESQEIEPEKFGKILKNIIKLTDRRKINVLQPCLPPCYQVKCLLEKIMEETFSIETAYLDIYEEAKTVPMFKEVYSFDIFMLSVELGSALGLWLGINIFIIVENKNAEKLLALRYSKDE